MRIFKCILYKNTTYLVYDTYFIAYRNNRYWYRSIMTSIPDNFARGRVYEITFDNYIKAI